MSDEKPKQFQTYTDKYPSSESATNEANSHANDDNSLFELDKKRRRSKAKILKHCVVSLSVPKELIPILSLETGLSKLMVRILEKRLKLEVCDVDKRVSQNKLMNHLYRVYGGLKCEILKI